MSDRSSPLESLYIRRTAERRYLAYSQEQIIQSLGNNDAFIPRESMAVSLLNSGDVNRFLNRSRRLRDMDHAEARELILSTLPESSGSRAEFSIQDITVLENGERPILAALLGDVSLDGNVSLGEERRVILSKIGELGRIGTADKFGFDPHVTIGDVGERERHTVLRTANQSIPPTVTLGRVIPLS